MEADIVAREGLRFISIPGGGVHGVALLNAIRNGWELSRGIFVALKAMRQERPDALLTTGGYVSGPVSVAAKWLGVPMLVYLPDVEPAQSVKAAGRLAARIATTVADSAHFLPAKKVVVTGYPLGKRITHWTRETGRLALGLDENEPVLLVFGGSRGARSINRALLPQVETLTQWVHIVHVSGTLDWAEVEAARNAMPVGVPARYQVYPYLHDKMGAAMAAADLTICRAGASTLGEFPHFGLPSVLVPYPYAWRYQRVNADWLAERGAAVIVEDAALPTQIVPVVRDLFNDTTRRTAMGQAALKLARPDAAQRLAQELLAVAQRE